jgi:hypothetical protein
MSEPTPVPSRPDPDPAVTAPSPSPLRHPPSSGEPPARLALNEDWAATVVGLLLLALVLTGLLPGWLVP